MNVVKEINAINQKELDLGLTASWHDDYKDSARIFAGNLHKDLTEGDVITIFSQYGEIMDIHMPRDKETGAVKGFAFLMYEDQRSTVLAVDNLNGAKVLERTLRVDHVRHYRQPRYKNEEGEWVEPDEESMNARPEMTGQDGGDESDSSDSSGLSIDPEDPMRDYLLAKRKEEKEARKLSGKGKKSKSKRKHKDETPEERAARKAKKREKKLAKPSKDKDSSKKSKSKSEGMKAVEDLLKGLGNPDMGSRNTRFRDEDEDEYDRRGSASHRERERERHRSSSPRRESRPSSSSHHREGGRERDHDSRRRSPSSRSKDDSRPREFSRHGDEISSNRRRPRYSDDEEGDDYRRDRDHGGERRAPPLQARSQAHGHGSGRARNDYD